MIKIIDTHKQINSLFENGNFCIDKWEKYINLIYNNSAHIFKDDIKWYLDNGLYTYDNDFLPIINAVNKNQTLEFLHNSFLEVTDNLNKKIIDCFGDEIDAEIVLYLGLCNAAGWATNINGKDVVLLGIEKIIELNWIDVNSMRGLIFHELGHIYHKQHGVLQHHFNDSKQKFLWQLFAEGIAMYFEQILTNDLNFYHQDINGWKEWCDNHFLQIVMDFNNDLPTMDKSNQKYFGDRVNYYEHKDVGYYLGTKFIHYLMKQYDLHYIINLSIDNICKLYYEFIKVKTTNRII